MKQVNLSDLQNLCVERKITWREHALHRMKERGIKREDVKNCIVTGEIIEDYPEDYPVASCLIFGINIGGQPLHVVCSIYEGLACIITAYHPNNIKWENDFKTRKAVQ